MPYDIALIRGSNEYEVLSSINCYLELDKFDKAQKLARAYMDESLKSMVYSMQEFHGAMLDEETLDREIQYASYLANMFRAHGHQEEYDWINESIKALTE